MPELMPVSDAPNSGEWMLKFWRKFILHSKSVQKCPLSGVHLVEKSAWRSRSGACGEDLESLEESCGSWKFCSGITARSERKCSG